MAKKGTKTPTRLQEGSTYLVNPNDYVPGTKMGKKGKTVKDDSFYVNKETGERISRRRYLESRRGVSIEAYASLHKSRVWQRGIAGVGAFKPTYRTVVDFPNTEEGLRLYANIMRANPNKAFSTLFYGEPQVGYGDESEKGDIWRFSGNRKTGERWLTYLGNHGDYSFDNLEFRDRFIEVKDIRIVFTGDWSELKI